MSIELSPDNAQYIRTAVARGQYKDPDEAVNQAVRLLRDRERLLAELRSDIEAGMQSGEGIPASDVFDQLENKVGQVTRRARPT